MLEDKEKTNLGHYLILLFWILISPEVLHAQYQISGSVTDSLTKKPIVDVEIYLDAPADLWQDDKGSFVLSNLKPGKYQIGFFSLEYNVVQKEVLVIDEDILLDIKMEQFGTNLNEVVVTERRSSLFGLTKLNDVQGVAIFSGKKTEVIELSKMVGNLATNNPRQIYAKVAGLNIWESDGAGLQLGIGGRGLDPNRTSNMNVRQNGYDISADALGYPESYYTPPSEALDKIEVVRGAASLQYGTQFGGLINFVLKKPPLNKPFTVLSRQTIGSFGLFNSFNSVAGKKGKLSYTTYFNYKRGKGWRPNSDFNQINTYAHIDYSITNNTKLGLDITHMNYLAHQAGGLSDIMFSQNPNQSNRTRNWFGVNWNLLALHLDHNFSAKTKANLRAYTLRASRKAVGYRNYRPSATDPMTERELIIGQFKTFGIEGRFLHNYNILKKEITSLLGMRYYQGNNTGKQGLGTDGDDANFKFLLIDDFIKGSFTDEVSINTSSYKYPNQNISLFTEHIFRPTDKISITPGVRFEHINTSAVGEYRIIRSNQAGDIIFDLTEQENPSLIRNLYLAGVGMSYKPSIALEVYGNLSQNFRSITFSDIRIVSPNSLVDPDIKDERGYSIDIGIRGRIKNYLQYDATAFALIIDDRLGDILAPDPNNGILKRIRTNVGKGQILGIESLIQWNILPSFGVDKKNQKLEVFSNTALINSKYTAQYYTNVATQIKDNKIEFVPAINLKAGLQYTLNNLKSSFQYSYLSRQFTDATNALAEGGTGTIGEIPSYQIMDLSFSYNIKKWKIETGINNLLNQRYFTRRATGYPGPGIIPSDARSYYLTLQYEL